MDGVAKVEKLTDQISGILAGHDPAIQSAVIADLAAMLLAGIQGKDKHDFRIKMLSNFIEQIIRLVPINEVEILAAVEKQKQDRRH